MFTENSKIAWAQNVYGEQQNSLSSKCLPLSINHETLTLYSLICFQNVDHVPLFLSKSADFAMIVEHNTNQKSITRFQYVLYSTYVVM